MSEQKPTSKADELYRRAWGPPRPKPETSMDPGHRALLALSVMITLAVAGYTALQIPSMPEQIPVHFGFDGSVNRYGSPMTALWLPLMMVAITLFVAWFSTKPQWMNYPFVLTEENAERVYLVGRQMMVHTAASLAAVTIGMVSHWVGWPLYWLTGTGVVLMVAASVLNIVRLFRAR